MKCTVIKIFAKDQAKLITDEETDVLPLFLSWARMLEIAMILTISFSDSASASDNLRSSAKSRQYDSGTSSNMT